MGTSSKTIQRRAKEWNIPTYSDSALIISDFPNSGEVMVKGHLLSQKVSWGMVCMFFPGRPSILNRNLR